MSIFAFLLPSFTACLVLTAIHTYLGLHVVKRGVIFVDIALAQIAALGMTVAFLFGFHPEDQATYFFALGFTFLGAVFLAYFRNDRVPQEALIGVSFAVCSAFSILLSHRLPHGTEHLQSILSGNILWVNWGQIIKVVVIYSLLGIFHYRYRDKFWLASSNPEEAKKNGLWKWDFLFYMTFALVITSSVQMGGILLVFSFLIVPALCGILFSSQPKKQLFVGWMVGLMTSALGMWISYRADLPTGPTIVTCFGLILALIFLAKRWLPRI